MRCSLVVAACLVFVGCSRYSEFELPKLTRPPGSGLEYKWGLEPSPVLTRGAPGEWDAVDALNPSVVLAKGEYWNFYSGYDGRTWHTGVAVSRDGITWTKRGRVLSPDPKTWEGDYIAANGTALFEDGRFIQWYQGGRVPQIGLAYSEDGLKWRKHGSPVLSTGPFGSWDERGVADPYVIRVGEWLYMYFLGQDRARRQRLGVARSKDGIHWEKHRANPIMEMGDPGRFDDTGLGEPAVWSGQGSYWMLYTGRDRKEFRQLGLARSQDGIQWERTGGSPIFGGHTQWFSAVVCDPHVLVEADGSARVYFGAGLKPQPAENLDGQIGYATLRLSVTP